METFKKSPVTWVLIVLNVLAFLGVEFTGGSENVEHMINCGAAYAPYIVEGKEYYRLFTCMFLHFGLPHLGNNMVLLYFVGGYYERAAGKFRFLLVYFLAGGAASALSCYLDYIHQENVVSAGASGAVFAMIGALLWVLIYHKGRLEDLTVRQIVFLGALSLYFGFASTGVDNVAHVGGLIAGFLLSLIFYHPRRTLIEGRVRY